MDILGCFHGLAIVDSAAVNIPVHVSDSVFILTTPRVHLVQMTRNFCDPRFDGHVLSQQCLLWLTDPSFLQYLLSWPSGCYDLLPIFSSLPSVSIADSPFSSRLWS